MFLKKILSSKEWLIVEDGYHPDRNDFHETIFTLANGYVGTRGALEEGSQTSCPGTYFAGVFDETPTYNTELANSPNWLGLKIIACGEPINLERGRILEFRRWLDMKNGILARLLRWKDDTGRITRLESFRLVHLEKKHQVLLTLLSSRS